MKLFYQEFILPNLSVIESKLGSSFVAGTGSPSAAVTAYAKTLVRTGTGDINVSASGNVDLTNGPPTALQSFFNGTASNAYQVGGTSIYTAGHPVDPTPVVVSDPDTGANITVNLASGLPTGSNFNSAITYTYGAGTGATSVPGILIADPVYAEDGGDISVSAGNDVLGRRDAYLAASADRNAAGSPFAWVGAGDEPWRTGSVGSNTSAAIDPQLFTDGLGTLGGGT